MWASVSFAGIKVSMFLSSFTLQLPPDTLKMFLLLVLHQVLLFFSIDAQLKGKFKTLQYQVKKILLISLTFRLKSRDEQKFWLKAGI